MKIAIVSGTFPPIRCGVGDYVERYTRALAAPGIEVHVITSKSAAAGKSLAAKGVTLWPDVASWGMEAVRPIRERIARLDPDVVHLQYPTLVYGKGLGINALPVALKRRWPRRPLMTTLHEFAQYSVLGQWRLWANIRRADRVVVTAAEERAAVLRRYSGARVAVIPIGSNIPVAGSAAAGRRLLAKLGVERGDRLLAYFGWVGPGKGVPGLVEATRKLWNAGWRVRLIGITAFRPRTDRFHAEVAARAKELEIHGRITWTGFLGARQVSDALLACEACVLPFDDGLRLNRGSFLAALQHGVPVVTTEGPAAGLLSRRAGRRLALCHPDAGSIARAVAGVLRRRVARDPRAEQRYPEFTWPGIAAAYAALYRGMLK